MSDKGPIQIFHDDNQLHSSDLSREMVNELKPWIDDGKLRVEPNSDQFFAILGRYPIAVNRIEWRGVRDHLVFDVLPVNSEVITERVKLEMLDRCRSVILDWLKMLGVETNESIVWIGDNSSVSLHMTVGTLLELYPLLFSWPQHSYVLPASGDWCLNYTMEGQLFLGKAENAIGIGYVDFDLPES